MTTEWRFEPGDVTRRKEVMDLYGGSYLGGIEPSARTPNVFIYTDPEQGAKHGYNFDMWDPEHEDVYYYTGDGQVGDQNPESGGNVAILRHAEHGRALRLLEVAGKNHGGGKPQRYVGEFVLDADDPWRYEQAPDKHGNPRKVVVFKLRALDPAQSRDVSKAAVGSPAAVAHTRVTPTAYEFAVSPVTLREAVFEWLAQRTNDGLESLTVEMVNDYSYAGVAVKIMGPEGSAWAPPGFGGVLSLRASYAQIAPGRLSRDDGLLRFPLELYEGSRRPVRQAMTRRLPVVWFQGVGGGRYLPIYPLYVVSEEREGFVLAPDDLYGLVERHSDSPAEETLRRYAMVEARRRLHQPIFRAMVLRAYGGRCAVCALGHASLLDAAHIVPDSHDLGIAAVRNGLSMCKLHHAAFDSHILGITPDLTIEVAARVMLEVDGPTLKHGLQGLNGLPLMIMPNNLDEHPDRELLALHYDEFRRAAG